MLTKAVLFLMCVWEQVVKAEVVGPVTLLNWSFPRADRSHREQCLQLGTHSKYILTKSWDLFTDQADTPCRLPGTPCSTQILLLILSSVFGLQPSVCGMRCATWRSPARASSPYVPTALLSRITQRHSS